MKSGADFHQFVKDLKSIGISYYDNYPANGKTEYYGEDKVLLKAAPKYHAMNIATESSAEKLKHALTIHQQGQTDYPTFCKQATEAGVEKWRTDIRKMNCNIL